MAERPTCKVVKREGERGARIFPKGCKVRAEVGARVQGPPNENESLQQRIERSGEFKSKKNKQGQIKYTEVQKAHAHYIILCSPEQRAAFEEATDEVKKTTLKKWWGRDSRSDVHLSTQNMTDENKDYRFGPDIQTLHYDTGAHISSVGKKHMELMGFTNNKTADSWTGPNGTVYNRAKGNLSSVGVRGVVGDAVMESLHDVPLCAVIFKDFVTPADTIFANINTNVLVTPKRTGLFGVTMIRQIQRQFKVKFKKDYVEIAD